MTDEQRPDPSEPAITDLPEQEIEDPIGDETDGEAATPIGDEPEAGIEESNDEPEDEPDGDADETDAAEDEDDSDDDSEPEIKKARPPAKLERLQKILAAAGVASRRKAEEMIEQGRVQVNGKVITEPGTKADAGRDHIRVDGKLLQGAERLRYFVLNKPRGFVTTVKDPEGRPTVMQFFDKMKERLYPVGRLDYLSEGLLVVTNDGELANKLTKASVGVEKTYLVKVAGVPTEGELDILRAGVAIEKGKPGSGRVRTSPARIRQVRQGDNPWYEVVLIEGRNRELRKMFEEIGHFVEKIRRVGYGPLILDQEPGHLRELDAQELELLRKAADGKLRTPKAKEIRRRNIVDSLPADKPAFKPRGAKPAAGPKDYKPKKAFGADRPVRGSVGPAKFGPQPTGDAPATRPAWRKDDRSATSAGRPPARFGAGSTRGERPAAGAKFSGKPAGRPFASKPGAGKPFGEKPAGRREFPAKPAWKKPEGQQWPEYKRPPAAKPDGRRRPAPEPEDLTPRKPVQLHIEPIHESERSRPERSGPQRTGAARPAANRGASSRPFGNRPEGNRPQGNRPADRTGGPSRSSAGRPSSARPFRSEGGLARPFTTSSGKPRPGGARPSSKPGSRPYPSGTGAGRSGPRAEGSSRPSFGPKRPFDSAGSERRPSSPSGRPFRSAEGEGSRPERKTGTGWKPKPSFRGGAKPGAGGGAKGKAGGLSKSGFKSKPGGAGPKRTGSKPGGKKPGAGRRP